MSDTLTDADEKTAEDSASHGRHRGGSAADDTAQSDPHGRHRAAAHQG
ncbi:hypothetical protein [Kitasatospora sp. NPDC101183]